MEETNPMTPDERIDRLEQVMLDYMEVNRAAKDRHVAMLADISTSTELIFQKLDGFMHLADRMSELEDRLERQEKGFE